MYGTGEKNSMLAVDHQRSSVVRDVSGAGSAQSRKQQCKAANQPICHVLHICPRLLCKIEMLYILLLLLLLLKPYYLIIIIIKNQKQRNGFVILQFTTHNTNLFIRKILQGQTQKCKYLKANS